MATICFYAEFVGSKVGVNGLTVTWDIERITRSSGARSALVTGGATSITVGRRGLYGYVLTGADLVLYDYVATAITAAATVDQQEVAAVWTLWALSWHDITTAVMTAAGTIGKLLVDNLDAAISTRGTANPGDAMTLTAAYDPAKTAAQAGDAMALTAGERTTTAMVIWNTLTSALTTAGSIGKYITDYLATIVAKTNLLGGATVAVVSPVATSGDITIIRGDSYLNVDGRRIEWSSTSWSIAAASTLLVIIQDVDALTATRLSATSIGIELTTAQTAALPDGDFQFSVQEVKVGGERITRAQGLWNTMTRPIPIV